MSAAAALAALPDVGPGRLRRLVAHAPPERTWELLVRGRLTIDGVPGELMSRWRAVAAASPDLPATMAGRLAALHTTVTLADALPEVLAVDPDPPVVLFSRGRPLAEGPRVAVVGTRRATDYGLRVAERLGRDLSESGVTVVSGLALGIDAVAHRGALAGPSPVVAVIGAGHDRPCPTRNRALAAEILDAGTVLSEVPPGVKSAPWRYPVRNRLIAALADVVVVVESRSAGGSMSTVSAALQRDRAVMAVPGSVGRASSAGCHDLLRDGAEICTGADDVLCLLGLSGAELPFGPGGVRASGAEPAAPADLVQAALLEALTEGPMSTDAALVATGAGLGELARSVAELERRGVLARRAGWLELVS